MIPKWYNAGWNKDDCFHYFFATIWDHIILEVLVLTRQELMLDLAGILLKILTNAVIAMILHLKVSLIPKNL